MNLCVTASKKYKVYRTLLFKCNHIINNPITPFIRRYFAWWNKKAANYSLNATSHVQTVINYKKLYLPTKNSCITNQMHNPDLEAIKNIFTVIYTIISLSLQDRPGSSTAASHVSVRRFMELETTWSDNYRAHLCADMWHFWQGTEVTRFYRDLVNSHWFICILCCC